MEFQRASTREQITQYLLERILDGTYKPGERLIELNIAAELKTSQAPVREALRDLEAMRVVVSEPYKGTRVREVTDRELEESSQVRIALEELGAQLAAPHLKKNVARITEEAKLFMKAARQKDVQKYSQHDIAFHRLIMEASGNHLLLSIWENVVLETRFRRTLSRIGEDQLVEFAEAHLPVIDALEAGDGNKAAAILNNLICKYHFQKN